MGTMNTIVLTVCLGYWLPAFVQAANAQSSQAIAVLGPTQGSQVTGTTRFTQKGNTISVAADVAGLNPGQKYALHIHEFGDCSSPDATSAGSHYNPEKHDHGLPEKQLRHAGDLGNLQEADAGGKARLELAVSNITIAGARNPILGRAVIVHAKADDGGQPVGNAGGRLACGVIGAANTGE